MNTQVPTNGTDGDEGLQPSIACPEELLPIGGMAGPWVVERELGRGGMGVVYAVVHADIGKRAALKVIHQRLLAPAHIERMLVEARVVNRVGHPNIVDIFETGALADGRPYIVMERLEGQSLAERARLGKILPLDVVEILVQMTDALIAAHAAGVVHRDLKTDNVFLTDDGVKLLDWGIAKEMTNDVRRTIEGLVVGTPQYLAPEQARGGVVSDKTDVYALGVVAHELFLEQLPFEAETSAEIMTLHLRAAPPLPRDLWPDIPVDLEDLLLVMLAKDPDHRPSMFEVARRLERIRGLLETRRVTGPLRTHAPTPPELAITEIAAPRFRLRKSWQYAIGVVAVIASAAMLWISHVSDNVADAAPVVESEAEPVDVAPPPPTPPPPPAIAAIPAQVVDVAPAPVVPAPATPHHHIPARVTPVHVTAAQAAEFADAITYGHTAHAATRKAPATSPRRASRSLDPDGTIDPYR